MRRSVRVAVAIALGALVGCTSSERPSHALSAAVSPPPPRTAAGRAPPVSPPGVPIPASFAGATGDAMVTVRDAPMFATGGVGFLGDESAALRAATVIARGSDAIPAFEWLIIHGSGAARLYAYWGLLEGDAMRAHHHDARLSADDTAVVTGAGCLIDDTTTVAASAAALTDRRRLPQLRDRPLRRP